MGAVSSVRQRRARRSGRGWVRIASLLSLAVALAATAISWGTLCLGEDGHMASLFPRHPSIDSDADGFIVVEGSPKPPPRRVSASRRLLARTGLGVLVVYGEAKRDAWRMLRDPGVGVRDCPSKLIESMPAALALSDLGDS